MHEIVGASQWLYPNILGTEKYNLSFEILRVGSSGPALITYCFGEQDVASLVSPLGLI